MLNRVRLVVTLAAWTALPLGAQSPSDTAGNISAVMPTTTVARGAAKASPAIQAVKGTPLLWRDTVQTGKSGRVRVQLEDNSVLSLGPDSKLRVVKHDARTQQTSLELAYGRIRCEVAKITRAHGSFELRTPTSVAGVIGTDFGADSSIPGQTKYICISGTVRIYSLDRRHYVDCKPGTSVVVNAGEKPGDPVQATPYVLERWQHITEPGDAKYQETLERGPDLSDRPPQEPGVGFRPNDMPFEVSGDWRARLEGWNWFADGTAQNDYAFVHSILHLRIGHNGGHIDWLAELAQTSVLGAPENAIAAAPQGQLGLGASYFAANSRSRNAAYVFPSRAFVRFHGMGRNEGTSFTLGRFTFVDGLEVVSRNPTLQWLKQNRIAHRLIGDFGFSVTGRSADGAKFSANKGRANITVAGARPTRGVFQVDGLGELDIGWQYGAVTVPFLSGRNVGELRVFGIGYQDFRAVAKTDNNVLTILRLPGFVHHADINIGTFGFDYLHALHTDHSGIFDFLLWTAGQAGSWGAQQHRAGAAAAELGWQPGTKWNPWFRAGYFIGSGDGNPADNRHNTFFPLLPTPRIYARFPFYNEMNNGDASAAVVLQPSAKVKLRSDFHALSLTSRNDLWYLGGGAFDPNTFGYAGRPSGGFRKLANVWDLSADTVLTPHWRFNFYYAHAWTGAVIRNIYPKAGGADFGYVESIVSF